MRYQVYRRVALPALLALACILASGWGKPVSSQTGSPLQAHSSPPLRLAAATEKGAVLTSTATATGCSPSWEIVASPNTGSGGNRLASVAVVSADDIWAVGYYVQAQAAHALTLHWNGIAWSIVPSPVPGAFAGELTGVTAISSDDVWAVGSYNTQGSYRRTLAMHWDGTSWNVITTPNLGDTTLLYAVTAVAPDDVWAIGSYGYPVWGVGGPISMHWDGKQWSLATMPRNPGCGSCSHLVTGITALSRNDIWVVGSYEPYGWRTLIEHWDGTTWTIVPSPNVGTSDSYLTGVTSNSPNDIWAVGYYMTSANRYSTLTLHWNGSAWSIVPSPNIGSNYTKLWEVDAVSSDDIWAVGSYANMSGPEATLIMHWNGTQWTIVPSPSPGLNVNELYGVAVISAGDVWAVGSAGTLDDSTRRTLIERYGGNCVTPTATSAATITPSATITPTQTTVATASASVTSISVQPTTTNTLVATSPATTATTASATYTATPTETPTCVPEWGITSNPDVGSVAGRLKAVAALNQDDIWAVGTQGGMSGRNETLIEHWDGVAWRVVSSPNVALSHNGLEGLAAIRIDNVWAVGYAYDGSVSRTLILHWNGIAWSIVPSPNVGLNVNVLTNVTAVADDDIWAVGYSSDAGGPTRTLILHWDGSQWTVSPSPNMGAEYNQLYGVDARASNDVWAVGSGSYSVTTGIGYTLILHWDGISWSIIPSPRPGVASFLQDVTVVNASDVWAVGSYREGGEVPYSLSLILHWDGTSWNVVSSPSPGANLNYLNGVSALSSNDIWAVGEVDRRTFTLHWNGLQWDVVASPSIGVSSNNLYDIVPVATSDVWAVGEYYNVEGQTWRPLIERYTDPCICYTHFTDVRRDGTFYPFVRCLACRGIISGYSDGTFRPNNEVTRGQLAKIVSNAAGFAEDPGAQIFEDVPLENTFYQWIDRLARRGYMSGYTCGGIGEPCTTGMPYFRPFANATRGQTSKIVSNAAGYIEIPVVQTFEDVPPFHTFYREIQRLANRNIMGGYPCGGIGEPCLSGKPYFRPQNNVTRGQSAKIVSNTFFPGCITP